MCLFWRICGHFEAIFLRSEEITRISYVLPYGGREEPLLIPACLIETNNRILVLNAGDGSLLESN